MLFVCLLLLGCGRTEQDFSLPSHSNFQDWDFSSRPQNPNPFKSCVLDLKHKCKSCSVPPVSLPDQAPLSPLWGHCRARPCSWSRGALDAPAGPAAGHWPSRPLCSYPARVCPAPPCLAFSPVPCLHAVPASRRLSPEWACGCRWTRLWLTAPHTASLRRWWTTVDRMGNDQRGLQPLGKEDNKHRSGERRFQYCWRVAGELRAQEKIK